MECCPIDPSLLAHLDAEGLHLSHLKENIVYPYYSHNDSHLTCIEFTKNDHVLAAGSDSGTVQLYNLSASESSEPMKLVTSLAARSPARGRCRAISWSSNTNRIAAGFDKEGSSRENGVVVFDLDHLSKTSTSSFHNQSRSSTTASSNQLLSSSSPVSYGKPVTGGAFGESGVSVQWLGETDHLAMGTTKWLRIWDVRTACDGAMRIMAHQKAVRGIELDPLRPHMLCTWSDGHAEPINVWDIRKLDQSSTPTPCCVIKPFVCSSSTHSTVLQVRWSPYTSGQLASIQSEFRHVALWDVNESNVVTVPIQVHSTTAPVRSICWSQANAPDSVTSKEALLYIPQTSQSPGSNIQVASMVGYQPIGMSVNADIVSSFHSEVNLVDGNEDMTFDVSTLMKERAMNGYCLDVGKNLQVLSDESDYLASAVPDENNKQQLKTVKSLYNMWSWVGRVEELGGLVEGAVETLLDSENYSENDSEYGSRSTMDVELHCPVYASPGRLNVLEVCGWAPCRSEQESFYASHQATSSQHMNMNYQPNEYMNEEDFFRLQHLIEECEGAGDIDRACCLAIFHGDLSAALLVLNNAQQARELELSENDALQGVGEGGVEQRPSYEVLQEEKEYQLRQVVAMCIAGYSSTPNQLWLDMCRSICGKGYLRQICSFLYQISIMTLRENEGEEGEEEEDEGGEVNNNDGSVNTAATATNSNNKQNISGNAFSTVPRGGISSGSGVRSENDKDLSSPLHGVLFRDVLLDEEICLEDRLAFSSRFLPHHDLITFLEYETQLKSNNGDLEGFMLLGFRKAGLDLLQNYLDMSGDIQTVALLCSHVEKDKVFMMEQRSGGNSNTNNSTALNEASSSSSSSLSMTASIMQQGEKLLKQWIEVYRDMLDGWQLWQQRAIFDVGRASLMRGDEVNMSGAASSSASASQSNHTHTALSGPVNKGEADSGLFIRCNFCNCAIPLTMLCKQANLKNKTWLQNQKPVLTCCPSCRNLLPKCYVCLMSLGCINPYHELKQRAQDSSKGKMTKLSSMTFPNWFTWCQVCKHGGHANHISAWFQSHATCGVTGCNCNCASL